MGTILGADSGEFCYETGRTAAEIGCDMDKQGRHAEALQWYAQAIGWFNDAQADGELACRRAVRDLNRKIYARALQIRANLLEVMDASELAIIPCIAADTDKQD